MPFHAQRWISAMNVVFWISFNLAIANFGTNSSKEFIDQV
jgi:hypothetical protein